MRTEAPLSASEIATIIERGTLTDAEAAKVTERYLAETPAGWTHPRETALRDQRTYASPEYADVVKLNRLYDAWYPREAKAWLRAAIVTHGTPITVERFDVSDLSEPETVKIIRAEVCRLLGETSIPRPEHIHPGSDYEDDRKMKASDVDYGLITISDAEYLREKEIETKIAAIVWPRAMDVSASIASYDCECSAEDTPRWIRVRVVDPEPFGERAIPEVTINIAI